MDNTVTPIPDGIISVNETKMPTFGEQLIGIEFSSTKEEDETPVEKVKRMMAEITNILKDNYNQEMRSPSKSFLFDHAVGEIVSAQMAVVKVLTHK
jgi:hypothetical protein